MKNVKKGSGLLLTIAAVILVCGGITLRPVKSFALCNLCPYCGGEYPSESDACPAIMSQGMPTVVKEMPMAVKDSPLTLTLAMRKLWSDHVTWTRQYIIAATAGLPDVQQAEERLMKNQEDIGNAFAVYYGKTSGDKLTKLLKQHIMLAGEVVAAAKANNQAELKTADRKWHANAVDIAAFLNRTNPKNWPKDALVEMLDMHLQLTAEEASARINKKWDDDVAAFDKVFAQAMMMSDALSEGIIKQFPNKF